MNSTVTRSLSGLIFIGAMLAGLLFSPWLFALLFVIMTGMMLWEFYRITMGTEFLHTRLLAIAAGIILFLLVFAVCGFGLPYKYISVGIIPILLVMATSLYVKDKADFGMFSNVYTGLLYIAIPLALSNLIAFHGGSFDGTLLLSFFIIIWASDVGAYVFGMSLGQRFGKKLFPEISPKKSWIGAIGGGISAILAAVILQRTGMIGFPMIHCIILALIMDVAGVYGDLFESQWKRCFDVKDSGNSIPGHGGFLDRFDSTLMAFPAGAVYLVLTGLL